MIDRRNPGSRRIRGESKSVFYARVRVERASECDAILATGDRPDWCWGYGGLGGHWCRGLWTTIRCQDCHQKLNKSAKRKSLHGMSDEEVDARAEEQGDRCPLCNEPYGDRELLKPTVDHIHLSGENKNSSQGRGPTRDVICGGCNRMLGYARDNPATLRRAADYVEYHAWPARSPAPALAESK
jgi:hypothetical protein